MCSSRYSYSFVEGQILNDNETESEGREQSEDSDAERDSKSKSSHLLLTCHLSEFQAYQREPVLSQLPDDDMQCVTLLSSG